MDMGHKPAAIIIANIFIFLLYLKFGSIAFWVPIAVGFTIIAIFVIAITFVQIFFMNFYEKVVEPNLARITSVKFNKIPREDSGKFKVGILLLIFIITLFYFATKLFINNFQ